MGGGILNATNNRNFNHNIFRWIKYEQIFWHGFRYVKWFALPPRINSASR